MKKQSNLLFVDRVTYTNLIDKEFNLNELAEVIQTSRYNDKLSVLTNGLLTKMNEYIRNVLYGCDCLSASRYDALNKSEEEYIQDYIKDIVCKPKYAIVCEKYYELFPLVNNDLLVIFEQGFLDDVTESKDNLFKFILDCLCYQYKYNSNLESLMKIYVSLKMNEHFLEMIKLRFN